MKQIIPFRKEILFKTMIGEITSIALDHTLDFTSPDTIEGDFIVSGTYKMTEASQIEEDFSYSIAVDVSIDLKYDTKNAKISIDDFYYEIINDEILKVNIDLLIDGLEEHQVILAEKIEMPKEDEQKSLASVEEDRTSLEKIEEGEEVITDKEEQIEEIEDISYRDETSDLFQQTKADAISLEITPQDEIKLQEEIETLPLEEEIITKPSEEDVQATPLVEKIVEKVKVEEPSTINSLFETLNDDLETFATYSVYIVREGDTIDSILERYKVTREDLMEYNNLEEVTLGSKLVIPANSKNESV